MPRPITLFTGQWADLPFDQMCQLASEWGYDGLEIAFDAPEAAFDAAFTSRD
jgi:sugar phosphate isomerase/epimerase